LLVTLDIDKNLKVDEVKKINWKNCRTSSII
jgi:hypothetical protein